MVAQPPEPVTNAGSPEQEPLLARASAALSDAVARLTSSGSSPDPAVDGGGSPEDAPDAVDSVEKREKKSALSAISNVMTGLAAGAKAGGKGAVVGGSFLAELLTETAHRLPLRDKATLLAQHPDLDTEQLADSLETAAARVSGAIGGAAGGLAAAQWLATPSLIAVPVELAAETLLVSAVELKLVAELHEIYDARPPGELGERATAFLGSWTAQRGLRGDGQTVSRPSRLASAGTAALRKRITGRLARNIGSFLPFLAGAVIGARSNSSGTHKLSSRLRADLARHPQLVPSRRLDRP